jgi:hypothetical protein
MYNLSVLTESYVLRFFFFLFKNLIYKIDISIFCF